MEISKNVASPLTDIHEHLLTEILLRLPAADDLARASATCVSFRRIVTDGSFLRRFRRFHGPPLLAFLDRDGFHPALPPHPSAPAARALALAADFTFSFLPSHCRWKMEDIRDGRVLLGRELEKDEEPPVFAELAVCDPLHRRYVLLPPVPQDLAASVEHPMVSRPQCKPFLVPMEEEEEETSFRVIWMAHCKTKLATFIFSSSTGEWQAAASKTWTDLFPDMDDMAITMTRFHPSFLRRHYANGCFYWDWKVTSSEKLLMLDTTTMEFSITHLPPGDWTRKGVAIVEAAGKLGRLGIFGFEDAESASRLSYATAPNKAEAPTPIQWQREKTISLDSGYRYHINAATERCLLLTRTSIISSSLDNNSSLVEYFSMDAKTLLIHKVCAKQSSLIYGTHIYTNFPPSSLLSSRAI